MDDIEKEFLEVHPHGKHYKQYDTEYYAMELIRWLKARLKKISNHNDQTIRQGSIIPKCEAERYWFKNILFQRLHKDSLWYAVYNNQIIDWDRYRSDLEERLSDYV